MNAIDVIKRNGRPVEKFSSAKLQKSIQAACLSVHVPSGAAEHLARTVAEAVAVWASGRQTITSSDIRRVAGLYLQTHHQDVAYIYEQHRHII